MTILFAVRTIRKDERKYYEILVQSSIQRLMLYPYHLADMIVKGMSCLICNHEFKVHQFADIN